MKVSISDGLLTHQEKYNKVVDAWSQCTDQVTDAMMSEMAKGCWKKNEFSIYDG